ncbi:hypothetical protein Nepgr_031089 [Nepenthes gracilis]|uniref:EGF-like domain-containing protein n=1 Tax=Nepenthes gracilis TaxID=150966 RepID=A0AAD3THG0_NEPGR|nr:hypothetical protein Nepgr_031089 [Nepenthes gracilis]
MRTVWQSLQLAGMAEAITLLAVAFVALGPLVAASDFLSPLLSPVFDGVCKEVECGKGNCVPSQNSSFPYECQCDPGWKRPLSRLTAALPCVIPNCTIDHSCSAAASPGQHEHDKENLWITNPCSWTDMCGGGTCNMTSSFKYTCVCKDGYHNLLKTAIFPCFSQCELGVDCSNLGISIFHSAPPPSPVSNVNGSNQASSHGHGNLNRVIFISISIIVILQAPLFW